MLVLSRTPRETIVIGGQVRVTVLSVKGNQVRIGIEAPKTIEVHREEIYDRIERERNAQGAMGERPIDSPVTRVGASTPDPLAAKPRHSHAED